VSFAEVPLDSPIDGRSNCPALFIREEGRGAA
jgi:hypothetical protein